MNVIQYINCIAIKSLDMNKNTVTVTFNRINGDIRISDAWVNK
ncbi:hypothetical protein GH839_07165 [Bacillus thuringiensis]|nr:hypothetical protein [Bacillus thuringiensis]